MGDIPPQEFGNELALNKWRRNGGAVTGVRILILVVGNYPTVTTGTYKRNIDNYILLLNNTFGGGNVVFTGAGFKREGKLAVGPILAEDYTQRKHLTQEEVESLLAYENYLSWFGEGKYDQIHFISHGGPDLQGNQLGMLFLKGFEDPEKKTTPIRNEEGKIWRAGFDENRADIMKDRSKWPINAGGEILLLGCDTGFGDFPGFLEATLPDCNVHTFSGIFRCEYFVDDQGKEHPVDWYSKYQHKSVLYIGKDCLQIKEPPEEIYEK